MRAVQTDSPSDGTIQAVAQVEHAAFEARSRMDHLAGTITREAGTGPAILLHVGWFSFWLLANLRYLKRKLEVVFAHDTSSIDG
jgi:uncharacterized membrane protein